MATSQVRPGHTHERVGVFTDAIFAIAITLLALELPRPEREDFGRLSAFLGDHFSSFLAFAIAFLMLWFAWRAHHTLFDQITRVSQAVLALHIPLLFFVVSLPYATSLFGEAAGLTDEAARGRAGAIGLFAANEAILMLCQGAMITVVLRQGLIRAETNVGRLRAGSWVNWAIGLFWALTAVLSGWAADLVPFLWIATPLIAYGVAKAGVLRNRRSPGGADKVAVRRNR
jgi:uncharacterized membrane protein